MTMERFPVDLPITKKDFDECGWQAALAASGHKGYVYMHTELSNAAKTAIEEGRTAHGKVLWLLSDACSMMLKPEKRSDPFGPFIVWDGRRSAIAEDFTDSDLDFFAVVVDEIDDAWLRARIADVLWTRRRSLGTPIALTAIDAYRAIPLDHDTWLHDGGKCWKRAVSLVLMLRAAAGDRLKEMETAIITAFEIAGIGDGYLALWVTDLLYDNGIGGSQRNKIPDRLASMAADFESAKDLHRARDYFDRACRWYRAFDDDPKMIEMTVRLAETWVKSAEERLASHDPSHMVAASFYENAIQIYRTIPRRSRPPYKVDERMEELRLLMAESGERSLGEMGRITTEPVDISEIVHEACEGVSGKPYLEALSAFVNHTRGVEVDKLKSQASEALKKFPIQALFSTTHISSDGRVIARSSGSGSDPSSAEEEGSALWSQMIRHYLVGLSLKAQGEILPAMDVLIREHRLVLDDFVQIARHSPIVPPGRERLWGTALMAGFDADFGTAIHLLCPQMEAMTRFHLKNAGVKTTKMDEQGIENEIGLSALVDLPEVETIFGKDLTFELKVLFCDAVGPNLRNEVAHGLLDDEVYRSTVAVYAWWLAMKLAFNAFWNRARKAQAPKDAPPPGVDPKAEDS